jgi:hypothetical protein
MTTQSRMRHRIIAAVISTLAQFLEDLNYSREPAWPRCLLAALEGLLSIVRTSARLPLAFERLLARPPRGNQPRRRNYSTVVIARPAP